MTNDTETSNEGAPRDSKAFRMTPLERQGEAVKRETAALCDFCDEPTRPDGVLRWHRIANEGDMALAHAACAHVYDGMAVLDRPF